MREKHIQVLITKKFILKKHLPFCSQCQFKLTISFLVLRTRKLKKKTFDFQLVHFIPRGTPIEVFIKKIKFCIIWVNLHDLCLLTMFIHIGSKVTIAWQSFPCPKVCKFSNFQEVAKSPMKSFTKKMFLNILNHCMINHCMINQSSKKSLKR